MLRGKYRSTFVTAWIGLKILKQGVATVSVEDLFLWSTQSVHSYIHVYIFYVFLTVHLSTILVINQLNAQNLVL